MPALTPLSPVRLSGLEPKLSMNVYGDDTRTEYLAAQRLGKGLGKPEIAGFALF